MAAALGVYGGCFDPFHRSHAAIAAAAPRQLPIERLLVAPTARPWQRQAHASLADRRAICAAALADIDGAELIDDPVEPGADSTTAQLLEALRAEHGRPLIFIVGGDAFAGIASWRRWEEALALASWAVIPRAGDEAWRPAIADLEARTVADPALLAAESGRIWRWDLRPPPLAASSIRARIAAGAPGWEEDLPPTAAALAAGAYGGGPATIESQAMRSSP
ncbi:MAG: nicotinate-nicotinamide nucleotide adenylyltransferase [Betaproteobacteria bacterium AqS2]|uniref:Probable nicotinate-nucleotide adenylyltransferase n=1 Tax=Candidatus Amphirhobacter heronislandensis TaxID=1732024 RepID=A0A930UGU8_9GAMM|nr:nicotinate-nicotinamide nucleotide adenylyltransferase [Betaproteobacteria bacterium AqS2]